MDLHCCAEGSRIASKDAEDLVNVLGRQLLILQASQAGISSLIERGAVSQNTFPATVPEATVGFWYLEIGAITPTQTDPLCCHLLG